MSIRPPFISPKTNANTYADTTHARIEEMIEESKSELSEDQSLLVEFLLPGDRVVIPTYIGYQNPGFILVYGTDANGNQMQAVLPHTNIHVLITTLNKSEERKSIGFQGRPEGG